MIDISQEQILDLLKASPNIRFTAQDIIHSIKGGLRKERFYENMRKLEKMDCIKKEKGCWIYVSE
ncbi:unnamed protein product [marine sediment metagenome]|uniref:Uncharacterized protein n=1 Tax=marine sediment metagenome TaxID=412755 RepID=X0U4J1_9ZZZZ